MAYPYFFFFVAVVAAVIALVAWLNSEDERPESEMQTYRTPSETSTVFGSSFGMFPRPSPIAHLRSSSATLTPSIYSETSRRISELRSATRRISCNPPDPDSKCFICREKAVTAMFLPCEHACMCEYCVETYLQVCDKTNQMKKCPYCRKVINRYEKISS